MRWMAAATAALALAAGAATPAAAVQQHRPSRCVQGLTAGEQTWTGTVDGVARTAVVYVPESAKAARSPHGLPAVVALHGSNNTPAMLLAISELEQSADAHGFVLIAPQGSVPGNPGTYAWNVPGVTTAPAGTPDDVRFLAALVASAARSYCLDTDEVFATGWSGGGRMISAVACQTPGLFAAIAPVVGLRAGVPVKASDGTWGPDPATCSPRRGTPVVTFTGTADPINPSGGGGAAYWQYGAQVALERWAQIDRCRVATARQTAPTVTRTTYLGCRGGNDVVSYVIDGAGHTWPGGNAAMLTGAAAVLGPYTDAVDANEVMWRFFRAHA